MSERAIQLGDAVILNKTFEGYSPGTRLTVVEVLEGRLVAEVRGRLDLEWLTIPTDFVDNVKSRHRETTEHVKYNRQGQRTN